MYKRCSRVTKTFFHFNKRFWLDKQSYDIWNGNKRHVFVSKMEVSGYVCRRYRGIIKQRQQLRGLLARSTVSAAWPRSNNQIESSSTSTEKNRNLRHTIHFRWMELSNATTVAVQKIRNYTTKVELRSISSYFNVLWHLISNCSNVLPPHDSKY